MGGKGNSASERQAARKEDRQRKDAYRKMKKKERGNGRWKDTYVEFGEQLKQIGLRFRDTKPDGNCLFRALADQLEGIENGHAAFRGRVVDFMRANPDDFMPFVDGEFADYCREMGRDGEWAGNLELVAASRVFNVHVIVHQLRAPRLEIRNWDSNDAKTIHLAYHDGEHYSSVRRLDDLSNEPAAVAVDLPQFGQAKSGGRPSAAAAAAADVSKLPKKVGIVMQMTGCPNVQLVQETLRENWDDMDATVEYLIALREAGDALFYSASASAEGGEAPAAPAESAPPRASPRKEGEPPQPPPASPKPAAATAAVAAAASEPANGSAAAAEPAGSQCPCGSGKKQRKCCGKAVKRAVSPPLYGARSGGSGGGKKGPRVQQLTNKERKALAKQQKEEAAAAGGAKREKKRQERREGEEGEARELAEALETVLI